MAISRRKANKAGEVLKVAEPGSQEYQQALSVMWQWREQHVAPTRDCFVRVSHLSLDIPQSIATFRLKRKSSILAKLRRKDFAFELGAMDDLGGCRLIVDDLSQLDLACVRLRQMFPEIKTEKDYVAKPQQSGYRSHHLIVQIPDSCGGGVLYRVEVQVRTKLQHYWATAVEAASEIYGKELKNPQFAIGAQQRDSELLAFFAYSSALFALVEGGPVPNQFSEMDMTEIVEVMDEHRAFRMILEDLEASADSVLSLSDSSKGDSNMKVNDADDLYLLRFSRSTQFLDIDSFAFNDLESAFEKYQSAETETGEQIGGPAERSCFDNVVLVCCPDSQQLEIAYPNYSSNVRAFVAQMKQLLGW